MDGTEPVCVWLEQSDGAVAVCDQLGRIGILGAGDAEAYLPLVTAARAQDKVVAAVADIQITKRDSLRATVRVVPIRAA